MVIRISTYETDFPTTALGQYPIAHDTLKHFTLGKDNIFHIILDGLLSCGHCKTWWLKAICICTFHFYRSVIQNVSLDKNQEALAVLPLEVQGENELPCFFQLVELHPFHSSAPSSIFKIHIITSFFSIPITSAFIVKSLSASFLKGDLWLNLGTNWNNLPTSQSLTLSHLQSSFHHVKWHSQIPVIRTWYLGRPLFSLTY